jgi:hypothetical protein
VVLDGEYERLRGTQDPVVNSGERSATFVVPAKDALLLLRPVGNVRGGVFLNGAYTKIFNRDERSVRSGFFNYDDAWKGGSLIGFYGKYKVIGSIGEITVLEDGREILKFKPFGDNYRGKISFALANLGADKIPELILWNQESSPQMIKVYRLTGSLIKYYYPYGRRSAYRGGTVAAGDVNGDGLVEIVFGASVGTRPEVRIYDSNFNLLKSFLAYSSGFRGGVNIALGDLYGNGKKQIITGAASAGGPHVKIFDARGREIGAGFFAFSEKLRSGVLVSAADTDGDGRDEILVMSNSVFTTK